MTSRVLSAGLATAVVVGLAAGAWAQSAAKSGRRAPKPASRETTQAGAPDAKDDDGAQSGTPFGTSEVPKAKDAFDEAETKAKGSATKAGDSPGASAPRLEKATFGAGCFWHVEAEFEWLPGVKSAVSGYSGGEVPNPSYELVHEGDSGHAEVVQVEYDPSVITYEQLLKVFWRGHDPTQWNRQGPDIGTQYRSVIFFHNEAQRKAALKSYRELTAARVYRAPIVTQLFPMKAFYRAEEYHQNYYGGKDDMPPPRGLRSRRSKSVRRGTSAATRSGVMKKESAASKSSAKPADGSSPAPGRQTPSADPEP